MGMFDWIKYEAKCEKCGEQLKGFQSKDGPCELLKLEPKDVINFYTSCDKCNAWHDFTVDKICFVKDITVKVQDI